MGDSYKSHVNIVGIVEIVLEVLYGIATLTFGILLLTGSAMVKQVSKGTVDEDVGNVVSTILIIFFVVLLITFLINTWLVWLVFTGGKRGISSRLSAWWIVQCVLLVINLIGIILNLVGGSYISLLLLLVVAYRIYSIHVVRSYANELRRTPPQIYQHGA